MAGCRESKGCSESKPGTHPDERITAGRVDRDAPGEMEQGAVAGAVEEVTGAAAGEGGGLPGGDIDTADAVAARLLRYIMGAHAESGGATPEEPIYVVMAPSQWELWFAA